MKIKIHLRRYGSLEMGRAVFTCHFEITYKINKILSKLSSTNIMRIRSKLKVRSTWVCWLGCRLEFVRCPVRITAGKLTVVITMFHSVYRWFQTNLSLVQPLQHDSSFITDPAFKSIYINYVRWDTEITLCYTIHKILHVLFISIPSKNKLTHSV